MTLEQLLIRLFKMMHDEGVDKDAHVYLVLTQTHGDLVFEVGQIGCVERLDAAEDEDQEEVYLLTGYNTGYLSSEASEQLGETY